MTSNDLPNPAPLQPRSFIPLPPGAIAPLGWLRDQLRLQASGLSGHLEEFWPDLGPDNMWLGGEREGWERAPYYLDGLVPLAQALNDGRLKAMADRWLNAILAQQREDGWIGPVHAPRYRAYDPWPMMIVLKVLAQHQEATGDARVIPAMLGFCRYLREHLESAPLFDWGRFRWADLLLSVHWLYTRTGATWLIELAQIVASQGYDWRRHFDEFIYREKTPRERCTLDTHVVNSAMAVKAGGVRWRQTGDPGDRESVYRTLEALDRYHGQVTGVFSGDEHYAGLDPSQGTELCAVVEYMFSLEELIAILGDPVLADRLERIAYNALPGTMTPDCWAHQYDQQANQVLCTIDRRQWTNNENDSNLYGLEPNFGCCTANLHQGWPKLVKSLWMASPDHGLAAIVYGPCEVRATVADGQRVRLIEETGYPFRESVCITVESPTSVAFPLLLRIPGWADEGRVEINGRPQRPPTPGQFYRIDRIWHPGDMVELTLPMEVRVERRYHHSASVVRGPLVLALEMDEEFRVVRGDLPHADYAVYPASSWNYALDLGGGFAATESPISPTPFAHETPPVVVAAQGRRLLDWMLEMNSAGALPESPVTSAEPTECLRLIPYGSTRLRISEFPVLQDVSSVD